MTLAIRGMGTALPRLSSDQTLAAETARTFMIADAREARALPALFRRTRVRRRGSVLLEDVTATSVRQSFYWPAQTDADRGPTTGQRMQAYGQHAAELAIASAGKALQEADLSPRAISHLVTVSCTGFVSPGVEFALIRQLGLSPTVGRANIGFMGCHGALNGLRVAKALVEEDPSARLLLCAVELCSLHYQYGRDPRQLVANALFADGSASLVASSSVGGTNRWQLLACGSYLMPDSEDALSWHVGDHGFEIGLSPQVPGLIAENLKPWLERWLAHYGYQLGEIASWAIHPGGPRILESAAEALGLPETAAAPSQEVLAECGNMSSPTVLFVLKRLQDAGAPTPCVALAFGPGLVAEAALFVS